MVTLYCDTQVVPGSVTITLYVPASLTVVVVEVAPETIVPPLHTRVALFGVGVDEITAREVTQSRPPSGLTVVVSVGEGLTVTVKSSVATGQLFI